MNLCVRQGASCSREGVEGGGGGGVEGAGFVGSFWLAHQITQIIAKPDDLT